MPMRCPTCAEPVRARRFTEGTVVHACLGCRSRLFLKQRDGQWEVAEVVEVPPAGLHIELDDAAKIEPSTYRDVDSKSARFRATSSWRHPPEKALAGRQGWSSVAAVLLLTTVLPIALFGIAALPVVLLLLVLQFALALALLHPTYVNRTTVELHPDRLEWRIRPIPSLLGRSGSLPLGAIERLETRHRSRSWWLPLPESIEVVAHTSDQQTRPVVTRLRSRHAADYLVRRLASQLS